MVEKSSLWKLFVSSLEIERNGESLECEKSGEESGEERMAQYNACVGEIKNEGNVLGSLEMHEEAMRRLNKRLGKAYESRVAERRRMDTGIGRLRENQESPFWKKNVFTRFIVAGKHGSTAGEPSKEKMPGRRESIRKPVEFDEDIAASQMLQDLYLSDSEDEGVGPPTRSHRGEVHGGRRPSLMKRGSAAVRRYSNRRSSEDGALICGWERRHFELSCDTCKVSLYYGKEEEAPGSLICGWD
ncbi:hypothetical protein ACHAW5_009138 [Stephanodiscus triporus]|uniref:Uncharacterized protein n=1 Tax=Stephanodiscus triporus TaxID=2934178 RepID=A0ABD3QDJ6_9STRA